MIRSNRKKAAKARAVEVGKKKAWFMEVDWCIRMCHLGMVLERSVWYRIRRNVLDIGSDLLHCSFWGAMSPMMSVPRPRFGREDAWNWRHLLQRHTFLWSPSLTLTLYGGRLYSRADVVICNLSVVRIITTYKHAAPQPYWFKLFCTIKATTTQARDSEPNIRMEALLLWLKI